MSKLSRFITGASDINQRAHLTGLRRCPSPAMPPDQTQNQWANGFIPAKTPTITYVRAIAPCRCLPPWYTAVFLVGDKGIRQCLEVDLGGTLTPITLWTLAKGCVVCKVHSDRCCCSLPSSLCKKGSSDSDSDVVGAEHKSTAQCLAIRGSLDSGGFMVAFLL